MSSRQRVGVVRAISRYPVKSMQGESLDVGSVGVLGLEGDRSWGVVNTETGRVLTAKRSDSLLGAGARLTETGPHIQLPDGTQLAEPGPATDRALSDWLDAPVALRRATDETTAFEMSFNVDDPDVDKFEWPTLGGTFQDLAPVHVLTTAALAAGAEIYAEGDWSVHRFRPTVLIETDAETGFVENDWVGAALDVGEVRLEVTMPTIRCALPTKAQAAHGLGSDPQVFKSLAAHNNQNLGAYSTVRTPGTISVGDLVTLVGL